MLRDAATRSMTTMVVSPHVVVAVGQVDVMALQRPVADSSATLRHRLLFSTPVHRWNTQERFVPIPLSVIDHVDLLVRDLEASVRFYKAALQPLGYGVVAQSETSYACGMDGADNFGINLIAPGDTPTTSAHVAFVAPDRAAVDAFHAAAIANGGTSKHPPAIHDKYHAGYYGAFVFDPGKNNIEAVFHDRDSE